jgi:antitoxin component YwqK of YwqJK toxin-antitoxin module
MNRLTLAVLLLIMGCSPTIAKRPSPEVTYQGDRLLYKGKRFSGILEERFEAVGTVRRTAYRKGLPDGIEEELFDSTGKLAARREFSRGKKVGVHEGWFHDGSRRFRHEFKDGQPDGEVWEWYNSGGLATYAKFSEGKLLGKKIWRESGQIYMNYVFTKDREVGVPGAKLCYQVRN